MKIYLSGTKGMGKFSIVDDSVSHTVRTKRWYLDKDGYAYTEINGKRVSQHRLITNAPTGMDVDHINHDKLDNRLENLRVCTRSQNLANMLPSKKGTSRYKGVRWDESRGKWLARISVNNKMKHLGRYYSEIDAARAYNKAAIRLRGEFALVNHID